MVLVGAAGHPLVRLQLGERVLPATDAVVGHAEHLAHGGRPGRHRLRLLRLRRRPRGVVALERARSRAPAATSRRVLLGGPRRAPDILLDRREAAAPCLERRALRRPPGRGFRDFGMAASEGSRRIRNGPPEGRPVRTMSRQRPTLPPSRPGSTIGAGGLNFRVRDGTGCLPSAMATETRCPIESDDVVRVRPSSEPREQR